MHFREESDSIGAKWIPADAYYGVHSLRGCENFRITGQRLRTEFIESLAQIKKVCAICNHAVGELDAAIKDAIKTGESVRTVLKNKHILSDTEIDRLLNPETMV